MRLLRRRPRDPADAEIRPCLWSAEAVAAIDVPLLADEVADGLCAVLCIDLPDTLVSLGPGRAAELGLDPEALWPHARANVDDGLPVRERPEGRGVRVLGGESMFVASRLLDLERHAGTMPSSGAVVAVPTSHTLALVPLVSHAALPALEDLAQIAGALHADGPNPLVPHLYWWRRDEPLVRVPVRPPGQAGEARLEPPGPLRAVLAALPPA